MPRRRIDQHLVALTGLMRISQTGFESLICARAKPKLECRLISSWFAGAEAQDRTLERLCSSLRDLADDPGFGENAGIGRCPSFLSRIQPMTFSHSVEEFVRALDGVSEDPPVKENAVLNGGSVTNQAPIVDPEGDVRNLFVVLRAIRRGATEYAGTIAVEPFYVEDRGLGDCRAGMITRIGRLYVGQSHVSNSNAYFSLQWRDASSTSRFSMRMMNLRRPARDLPPVYGGLLQRSTSSNSDPSSCVVAALRLVEFTSDQTHLDAARTLLSDRFLGEPASQTAIQEKMGRQIAGSVSASDAPDLCGDAIARLGRMISPEDLSSDGSTEGPPRALSMKIVSPEDAIRIWQGFSLKTLLAVVIGGNRKQIARNGHHNHAELHDRRAH